MLLKVLEELFKSAHYYSWKHYKCVDVTICIHVRIWHIADGYVCVRRYKYTSVIFLSLPFK